VLATFSEMGSPVMSGMITSVLASLPLFACNIVFFSLFGTFLWYMCVCVCVRVCVCVCVCVIFFLLCVCVCVHTYIHTHIHASSSSLSSPQERYLVCVYVCCVPVAHLLKSLAMLILYRKCSRLQTFVLKCQHTWTQSMETGSTLA
jgi:hypothetical protein